MDSKKDNGTGGDPANDEAHRKENEENRREMDEVPEPGTDPLHEGP